MREVCTICGRVRWGNWVPLGFGKWRHDECALGSQSWNLYYLSQPMSEQRRLQEFYEFTYPPTKEAL